MIDLHEFTARLERNVATFQGLLTGVEGEQISWHPAEGKWSMLEVVNHLADEERDDFRTRLDYTLHRPGESWPSIDPEGWVLSRGYAERDFAESCARFFQERERSLQWLRALQAPDWEVVATHPVFGSIRAGDIFLSWVAHDYLHIRQLTRLHYDYLKSTAAPYSPQYAGDW